MHAVREGFPKEAVMLSSVIVLFDTPSARTPNDDCKIKKKTIFGIQGFIFFGFPFIFIIFATDFYRH